MAQQRPRKLFSFKLNRYEKPLVNFILFPCTLFFLILFTFLGTIYYQLTSYAAFADTMRYWDFSQKIFAVIVILWIFLFFLLVWSYRLSNSMVGAFERIIREIDEFLVTGHKRKIQSREKDSICKELLDRINVLIERMPDKKN